jgi:hypothetical protein
LFVCSFVCLFVVCLLFVIPNNQTILCRILLSKNSRKNSRNGAELEVLSSRC